MKNNITLRLNSALRKKQCSNFKLFAENLNRKLCIALALATSICSLQRVNAQCPNTGTYNGSYFNICASNGTQQLNNMLAGYYVLVNVIQGYNYTIRTCGAPHSLYNFDTQLTLYRNDNGAFVGYSDDNCNGGGGISVESSFTFTAGFTGALRVQLNQFNCSGPRPEEGGYTPLVDINNINNTVDNSAAYGNGSWIGQLYDGTGFNNYAGYVLESENFNQNFGGPDNCLGYYANGLANAGSMYTNTFSIRYRMTKNFPCGIYTFTTGSDDGRRLSSNGGASWNIVDSWINQGYAPTTSGQFYMSGNYNMVYEYYESSGGNQVSMQINNVTPALVGGSIGGITSGLNICSGADPGSFTNGASGSGGVTAFVAGTYQWESSISSGAGGFGDIASETGATYDPGALTQTTWFRRRFNDACGVSYSNVIQVNVFPASMVSISGKTTFCTGDTVELNAGLFASYNWSTGETTQTILVNSANTFTVTVTDSNGCTGMTDVTTTRLVAPPVPIVTGNKGICQGISTTLKTDTLSGLTYCWRNTASLPVWGNVGSAGFSAGQATYQSLVFNGNTPYLAFSNGANGNKTTVMKFDGNNWVVVGSAGFSAGQAGHQSLVFNGNTPYVAYSDFVNGVKTTVMKFDGSNWVLVGSAGFSAGQVNSLSLAFTGNTPYVAYSDLVNGNKTTVMKFDGSNWVLVGSAGFSAGFAIYQSLAFNGNTPYVAYSDFVNGDKTTVMKFDGSNWVVVGSAGFSAGEAAYQSLVFNGNSPYVAYSDAANGTKTTVMKFDGSNWVVVGSAGFSVGGATFESLAINYNTPYVAYRDWANGFKTTVMKFDGSNWVVAGSAGFSAGNTDFQSLAINYNTPYVAYRDYANGFKTTVMKFDVPCTSSTDSIVIYAAGSYTVTATDTNGCSATSATVTITNTPPPVPSISGKTIFCTGDTVELNAGSFAAYSWSTGETTQAISVNTAETFTVTVTDDNGCTGSTSVTTTVNPNPTPTISGNTSFCDGSSTTLDAGSYESYEWSTGETTQAISVNSAETFTVTVTDDNGCTGNTLVTTTVNPNPTPTISGSTSFCDGSSTTLDAGIYESYEWSTGETTQTISVNSAETFTVTVTDANGCTGSSSVTTSVNANPTPTISGSTSFCDGSSTTLDAGSYESYEWSTGETTQTISVSTAETFTVTVTDDNGCTGNTLVTTTVNPNPTPTISGSTSFCDGSSTTLDAGSYESYEWSTGETTQTISVNSAETFTVTVADANGCTGSTSVTTSVNANPTPTISGSTSFCDGSSTTLDAGSYESYEWSTGETSQTISVNTAGTFTVTVTDANGCTGSTSVTTTVNPNPTPTISGSTLFCAGSSTTLDAGTWAGYNWSTGATTQTISVNTAGTFTVTVTDANGCTGTTSITVSQSTLAANCSGTNPTCGNADGKASANAQGGQPPYSFLWSNGSTDSTITGLSAGTYTVTVTDAFGCTDTCAVTLINGGSGITPTISCNAAFCAGKSTLLDAGAGYIKYKWSTGATTRQIIVNTANTFTVTVTDANGCTGSASVTTTVYPLPSVSFSGLASSYNVNAGYATLTGSPSGGVFSGPGISGNKFYPNVAGVGGPYTITYSYTNSNGCSKSVTHQTSVTGNCIIPAKPGTIAGSIKVCPGESKTYSISPVANATSYLWTPPTGCTVSLGQGGTTVTVNYGNGFTTSGSLTVKAVCACGSSPVNTLLITKNTAPALPSVISGASTGVCNGNAISYSITNVAGNAYTWGFSTTTASITLGQGTNSVKAKFNANFTSGNITVKATNGCGTSATRSLAIKAVPDKPGAITGTHIACSYQQNVPYSISPVSSAINYSWLGPVGSHIKAGTTTSSANTLTTIYTSVKVNFGATVGAVQVKANNSCGSGAYASTSVTVHCREVGASLSNDFEVVCYPIPATNELNVSFLSESVQVCSIRITDVLGKTLLKQINHSTIGENKLTLNVSMLSSGIYMIEVLNGEQKSIQKIMIE